jgi:hypothetical protein
MSQSNAYTPQRRRVMHGIMWLILLATLGVAALLTQWWKPNLQAPRIYGEIKVALPKDWTVRYDPRGRTLVADDPRGGGRHIAISVAATEGAEDPRELLISSGVLPAGVFEANPRIEREVEEIRVKDGAGVMLHVPRARTAHRDGRPVRDRAMAALLFRDGRGVLIQLSDPEANGKANDALILGVAESVQMQDAKGATAQ